jgi:hypothetical protein
MRICLLALLLSCTKKDTMLVFHNQSATRFDSVRVYFCYDKAVVFKEVMSGNKLVHTLQKDDFNTTHDIVYNFQCFKKDSIVLKGHYFIDDLGHVPDSTFVTLTDSLEFKYDTR